MFRVIVIFLSDYMANIVLKSCETCNASTLLHTPAGDVWSYMIDKVCRSPTMCKERITLDIKGTSLMTTLQSYANILPTNPNAIIKFGEKFRGILNHQWSPSSELNVTNEEKRAIFR